MKLFCHLFEQNLKTHILRLSSLVVGGSIKSIDSIDMILVSVLIDTRVIISISFSSLRSVVFQSVIGHYFCRLN